MCAPGAQIAHRTDSPVRCGEQSALSVRTLLIARPVRPAIRRRCQHSAEYCGQMDSSEVDRGVDEGWIEPSRGARLEPVQRAHPKSAVLDALEEDRGDR